MKALADGSSGKLNIEQIASLPWVDYEHDTPLGRIVGNVFENMQRRDAIVGVRSAIRAFTLARESVGVAIVDPFHWFTASLLYSHAEPLSSLARRFVELLHEVLKQHREFGDTEFSTSPHIGDFQRATL